MSQQKTLMDELQEFVEQNLDSAQRAQVKACIEQVYEVLKRHDEGIAIMAISTIGICLQAELDKLDKVEGA